MTDPKAVLDEMRAATPKAVDVNARLRNELREDRDLRVARVLLACWEALMEVRCERELAEQHDFTLQTFMQCYHDSLIVPILVGTEQKIAGAMWFKDGLVHLAIKREFRKGAWTRRLPEMFAPGFRAFGDKLIAVVNRRNLVARRFTEGIGGKKLHEDETAIVYELLKEKMRYWPEREDKEENKSA